MLSGTISLIAQSTVTISVNMSQQTVDPNGVYIAGSFQDEIGVASDWQPDQTMMMDAGLGDGTYVFTAMLPDGVYEYKVINGNTWDGAENVPAESQVGGGNSNRFFVVDGSDVFVPGVYFGGNDANAGGDLYMIRFTVDMGENTIDPAGVSVAGSFQSEADLTGLISDWTAGANKMYDVTPDNNLNDYTTIVWVPAGTGPFEYKFVNGGSFEDVPSSCSTNNNRGLTVDGTTLEKYCYGTCSDVCVPVMTYTLTLNIDMNYNCNFDINSDDSVDVAGTFNSWTGGDGYYLSDDDNDGIYSITISDVPGGEVQYKARIVRNGSPNWEGSPNNVIDLSADTDVPARCFGSATLAECAPIPDPSDITFRVDLTDETPAANIYMIGDFTDPQWQGGAVELQPVAPGIYEATVTDICPGTIAYKFVNGDVSMTANEESFPDSTDRDCVVDNGVGGFNRTYTRTSSDPVTLAFKFNTCQEIIGFENVVSPISAMFPNPAQNETRIQFASSTDSYNVIVSDILGKRVDVANNVRGYHIVHRGNLPSGIYLVQVTDAKGNTATQKLIFN